MGPITAVDSGTRVQYSLLSKKSKSGGWEPSTGCSPECKAGTFCCAVKPDGPACFDVPCKQMPVAPNMSAPFMLAQINIDTAKDAVPDAPALCSIAGNDCPWVVEVFEKQVATVDDACAAGCQSNSECASCCPVCFGYQGTSICVSSDEAARRQTAEV
jgi:hypothetical protein